MDQWHPLTPSTTQVGTIVAAEQAADVAIVITGTPMNSAAGGGSMDELQAAMVQGTSSPAGHVKRKRTAQKTH